MHIASCSKLITAIAMTRTLAAHNLPATTKIIDYLPGYWTKGPNIDKITFAELMTHTSGFRVTGSDMSFPTMKALIAGGVVASEYRQLLLPEHQLRDLPDPAAGHERHDRGRHGIPSAVAGPGLGPRDDQRLQRTTSSSTCSSRPASAGRR